MAKGSSTLYCALNLAITSTIRTNRPVGTASVSGMTTPRTFIAKEAWVSERTFTCSDGVNLATRYWTNFDNAGANGTHFRTRKILCLHGWLDNAASFNRLAPSLIDSLSVSNDEESTELNQMTLPTELVALDFPGHGLSGHKSADGPPQLLAEYAYYVAECVEALKWGSQANSGSTDGAGDGDKIIVIGHSMGGAVAIIFTAAFPELCSSLILIEGGGLLARNAKDCARHVRAACQRRLRSNRLLFRNESSSSEDGGSSARIYPNLGAAIEARLATVKSMPGDQSLSPEAAEDLVSRAIVPATHSSDSAVTFRHDPRLQWPSLQYFTREQVEACYDDIHNSKVPVCLLVAEDGFPVDSWTEEAISQKLQPGYVKKLPGSHHFHADPDTVRGVVDEIARFMKEFSL